MTFHFRTPNMGSEMKTDQALLARWAKEQCEVSFSEVVRRRANLIYATAYRSCNDPQIAEEAMQMTLVSLARKARALAGHPELLGWLHVAVIKHTRNLVRKREREARKIETYGTYMPDQQDDHQVEWRQLRPLLDDALARLRSKDREIILMRYFSDLSVRDLADRLGIAAEAAQKRLSRAMEQLRAILGKRGYQGRANFSAILSYGLAKETIPSFSVSSTAAISAKVITAAKATGLSGGAITVLSTIIMKKSTITACAILAAAAISSMALLSNEKLSSSTEETRTGAASPGNPGNPGDESARDTSRKPTRNRGTGSDAEQRVARLKQEFGDSRTNLSRKVGDEIMKTLAHVVEVEEIMLAEESGQIMKNRDVLFTHQEFEGMALEENQKERIFKAYLQLREQKAQEHRELQAALKANPSSVMEQLLLEDAIARKRMSPDEGATRLQDLGNPIREVMANLMEDTGMMGDGLSDPEFDVGMKDILTNDQYRQYSEVAKANREGHSIHGVMDDSGNAVMIDGVEKRSGDEDWLDLESQEKTYSSMQLMMSGMKNLIQAEVLSGEGE
jgi:RNA polymerase sigma factor (sigma-70 family)